MMKYIFILLFAALSVYSTELYGKVIKVYDGDTIRIETIRGEKYKVRFSGIDAPESLQPCGDDAAMFLKNMLDGRYVLVTMESIDVYGRVVGTVYFREGTVTFNANAEMIANGLAWFYSEYSSNDAYRHLECQAREAKRGLWSKENPVMPWEFRKMKKECSK